MCWPVEGKIDRDKRVKEFRADLRWKVLYSTQWIAFIAGLGYRWGGWEMGLKEGWWRWTDGA